MKKLCFKTLLLFFKFYLISTANFTDHEKAMFENGLEFHQKNFREIRKSMVS